MTHPATLRLFVCLHPPAAAVERLLALLATLELAAHRVVSAEQVHMTLQFIGEARANHVDDIAESVERSVAGIEPFELTPVMLATLPDRGGPRLVAAMTDAPPGLSEIHRRLVHRLAHHVRPDKDRFTPHLTLCRFMHGAAAERVSKAIDEPAFRVERVSLMRSVLRPDGAEHKEVRGFVLS